ncbi:MAG: bifunctional diguanylate cyclase/phosphodiesterase [Actinomycetota bacterium]
MTPHPPVDDGLAGSVASPARARRVSGLVCYAVGVGLSGLVLMAVVLVLDPPFAALADHPLPLLVLAGALLVGELRAIPVPRGDDTVTPITISTIFVVALVVLGPLSFALGAMAVAVLIDDLVSRLRPVQMLFNVGQYAISLIVARCVYSLTSSTPLLGGLTPFDGHHLVPALAAGAAFVLVNDVLVGVVIALSRRVRVRTVLTQDTRFTLQTSGVLVGLAPIAALLLKESVLMLPLLVLPILTVGRAAHFAVLREQQSLHDPLTGLANRELFRMRVEQALAAPGSPGLAVLMLDLDYFKDVNDALGHHVGDELLCVVAKRITEAVRSYGDQAAVARLGGDEFAVLLITQRPEHEALQCADRLLRDFSLPVDVHGTRLSVQASIGITSSEAGLIDNVHSALKQADIALYESKQERARASVYRHETMTASTERVRLLPELHEAIDSHRLAVLYQPQIETATGRVISVEALVRWDHPTEGRLAPATFIDLAESAGLIAPITTFVLGEALAAVAQWQCEGSAMRVSVNVSARQLSDLRLPEHVAELLRTSGAPASALTIEVTEGSLMADPRAARTILRELRTMGVQLSIDDFGTGYSSLVLLQQLDVDELKIDRSFVMGMASGRNDDVLVRSIIDLGHNLGLTVVAEGVETTAVAEHLQSMGCDLLQGYLFSRPLDRAGIDDLLRGERAKATAAPVPVVPAWLPVVGAPII